jgi:hypothetical protein
MGEILQQAHGMATREETSCVAGLLETFRKARGFKCV